jgi:hypothetical protein
VLADPEKIADLTQVKLIIQRPTMIQAEDGNDIIFSASASRHKHLFIGSKRFSMEILRLYLSGPSP